MDNINQKKFLIASILGLVGFIINLYPLPLFANIQLILGNASYVICAILFGPWYALYTAMISVSGLFMEWDSWHVYLLFPIEAVCLGLARRKDIYSLYASIIFWIVIGMPLFYLYAIFNTNLPSSHLPFIILKQGINGVFYAGIGSLLVILTPSFGHFQPKAKHKQRRTFNAQLTYAFTLVISLALLLAALLFNNQFINRYQSLLSDNIKESAQQLGTLAQAYIDTHVQALNNAASGLSLSETTLAQQQLSLSKLHQMYPGFITMLIANEQGHIKAASPVSRLQDLTDNDTNLSVIDRDYFIESFVNQRNFISPVFLGRGFGNDPIVAISAPLYAPHNAYHPIGIIEGSLDLNKFREIDKTNKKFKNQSMVLVDRSNRVIFASPELSINPLSAFSYSQNNANYTSLLPMLNIIDKDNMAPEYVFASFELENKWTLYVLNPFRPLVLLVENMYLATFAILVISLLITFFITRVISARLTLPLERIANRFSTSNENDNHDYGIDDESPKEVYSLYMRLKQSKSLLIGYQLALEEKVALRTYELEQANIKLKTLAEKDSLTGLYNRRYAEDKFSIIQDNCQRSDEVIAIALLDLDRFKHINDTYGHLSGDLTLKTVAKLLNDDFKRDGDIIVRFGGEEFLIIMPLCNALKIESHLEHFKQKLADTIIAPPGNTAPFNVTTSIGAVIANGTYSDSLEDWIKQADINLYSAKNGGRNKLVFTTLSETPAENDVNQ
ncbi:diguanylate cyclase [Shewanella gelidimarina]|uniref:sensor domain-containing diguanylate cyclase n=1 Tax=Shewanella gelidimarina TaxID=56813 RepID=UPI00200C4FA0|nr:diguanylate cyclase [Shewanella gelidimarina]MCL1058651.1 diguanylate cyclase [Shewanella gelidimarina]